MASMAKQISRSDKLKESIEQNYAKKAQADSQQKLNGQLSDNSKFFGFGLSEGKKDCYEGCYKEHYDGIDTYEVDECIETCNNDWDDEPYPNLNDQSYWKECYEECYNDTYKADNCIKKCADDWAN